jgi:hypothetical protein
MPIDKKPIEEARKIGGYKTQKEAVAGVEPADRRNRLKILSAFGTVDFDPSYDYKIERKNK